MAARGALGPQPLTAISRSGDRRFAQTAQIIACRTDVGSEWRRSMKTVPLPALLAILAALSANPAAAQQRAGVPQQVPPLANPSPSSSASSATRLQQQILNDAVILDDQNRRQREHEQRRHDEN
jgi:hypothetical protein